MYQRRMDEEARTVESTESNRLSRPIFTLTESYVLDTAVS